MTDVVRDRELHKQNLAEEVLRSQGVLRLRVAGTSMLPTLWPGDLVSIERTRIGAVMAGDLVLYQRDRRFFLHRVVERLDLGSSTRLVTQGDALPDRDVAISGAEVLGRLTAVRRRDAWVIPVRKLSALRRLLFWMVRHSELFKDFLLGAHAFRSRGIAPSWAPLPATSRSNCWN
jgi:hypothetical protein